MWAEVNGAGICDLFKILAAAGSRIPTVRHAQDCFNDLGCDMCLYG